MGYDIGTVMMHKNFYRIIRIGVRTDISAIN